MAITNRVWETSATSGAGNLTLAGAVSGYQTFNSGLGVGPFFTYWIDNEASLWETGTGHLSDATTLVRDTVVDNSAGTTVPLSFTGSLQVFLSDNSDNWVTEGGVIASGSGTINLDLSLGNEFRVTLTGATTVNFTSVPATGVGAITVRFIDADVNALTLDADVTKWRDGVTPTISGPIYELGFKKYDGEITFTGYDIGVVAAP